MVASLARERATRALSAAGNAADSSDPPSASGCVWALCSPQPLRNLARLRRIRSASPATVFFSPGSVRHLAGACCRNRSKAAELAPLRGARMVASAMAGPRAWILPGLRVDGMIVRHGPPRRRRRPGPQQCRRPYAPLGRQVQAFLPGRCAYRHSVRRSGRVQQSLTWALSRCGLYFRPVPRLWPLSRCGLYVRPTTPLSARFVAAECQ